MKTVRYFWIIGCLFFLPFAVYSQKQDTVPPIIKGKDSTGINAADTGRLKGKGAGRTGIRATDSPYAVDSMTRKRHNPRKATLYSTFCPGLGQIYNRKYWKLPLVYTALGIPAYTYFNNKSEFKKVQFAITAIVNYYTPTTPVPGDVLSKVDPRFRTFVVNGEDNQLRSYRDYVRKNQDYSVLFFLLFWGLQIVDATVDAHLKDFDVSNELSLRLQPMPGSPVAPTSFGLVVDIHKPRFRSIPLP